MKEKGFGGGNTLTGLNFEREVDLQELIAAKPGYKVKAIHGKAKGTAENESPPVNVHSLLP